MAEDREQKLWEYLQKAVANKYISADMRETALSTWHMIREATAGKVPVPNAGPGPNAELLFTWDREEHHMELEFFARGGAYLFYANRSETPDLWGEDYDIGAPISAEAVRYLKFFSG